MKDLIDELSDFLTENNVKLKANKNNIIFNTDNDLHYQSFIIISIMYILSNSKFEFDLNLLKCVHKAIVEKKVQELKKRIIFLRDSSLNNESMFVEYNLISFDPYFEEVFCFLVISGILIRLDNGKVKLAGKGISFFESFNTPLFKEEVELIEEVKYLKLKKKDIVRA